MPNIEVAWAHHYGAGLIASIDHPAALAVDGAGNVYVTGTSHSSATSSDYATAKYDAAGQLQWVRRYNGASNDTDGATAIAVDAEGNVYVAGYSWSWSTAYDFALIKYNAAGGLQWVARYNGPANDVDGATALALDATGNAYVTGWSRGRTSNYDFATIKYNSAGVRQWVARYNGSGNGSDNPVAIAVRGTGEIVVTGSSRGGDTGEDYLTLQYSGTGEQQWLARYDGPAGGQDRATSLALAINGDVFVTGSSQGVGSNYDYATIRYDATGSQLWVARYNGTGNGRDFASALAISNDEHIVVTGTSRGVDGSNDYATVKYNAAGEQQWLKRYSGPGTGDDQAAALAIDSDDNVYVTGYSMGSDGDFDFATLKYTAAGSERWQTRYNGPAGRREQAVALVVDGHSFVYVAGYSENAGAGGDYATIKYDAAGAEMWAVRYAGPGNSLDEATALAFDVGGNVYVTGRSYRAQTGDDYATVKYSAVGVPEWTARYNGPADGADEPAALAVDGAGNIIVTGHSLGVATNSDFATIKYNAAGVEQWVARYNSPADNWDRATALQLDAEGNVYVTGESVDPSSGVDYLTIKYSPDGRLEWVRRYSGPGRGDDGAVAMALDGLGNIYVTGNSWEPRSRYDFATVKYNMAGDEQWVARFNRIGDSSDFANALVVDADGNSYVAGYSLSPVNAYDYTTIKYDAAGNEQWQSHYNGLAGGWDIATALGLDEAGNVYVTGRSQAADSYFEYATLKYNAAGTEQWAMRYRFEQGKAGDHGPTALAMDGEGSVYVTGYSWAPGTGYDYATIKYDSDGQQAWIARHEGPGSSHNIPTAIAIDMAGDVAVTGWSTGSGWSVYTTIKYSQPRISQQDEIHIVPPTYALRQNYPNPFNPETTISYEVPQTLQVRLVIYDLKGRQVRTLVEQQQMAGRYAISWDGHNDQGEAVASGVFIYRLQAGEFTQVRKMTLLR